jgi:hypothetical protein
MAKRSPQTAAKREREQAKREKRERKLEKKAARAAPGEDVNLDREDPIAEASPDFTESSSDTAE